MRLAGFFEVHAPESMSRLTTFLCVASAIAFAFVHPTGWEMVGVLLGGGASGLVLRGKAQPVSPTAHPDAELAPDAP